MRIRGNLRSRKSPAPYAARVLIGVFLCLIGLVFALALSSCSAKHYRRSADKETYRAIGQKSPLVKNMDPHFTIEQTNVIDLSGFQEVTKTNDFLGPAAALEIGAKVISLQKALEISVQHSRTYQNSKEQLYLTALSLTLSRHQFAPIFKANDVATINGKRESVFIKVPDTNNPGKTISIATDEFMERHSFQNTATLGVDWLIRDIGRISAAFTTDFLHFLNGDPSTVVSSHLNATFIRPLLRNAGFKAEMENLTQAERDLLYGLRDFVRFRKDFSVQIASAYYGVLGNRDAVRNSYLNLESSRRSADRTRALAAEGRTTQTDLGRIEQQALSAESAWVNALASYQRSLDDFKIRLGIPVETKLALDDRELEQLQIHHPQFSPDEAIKIALAARLDYQNAHDALEDSDRKVDLALNQLKPQLDLAAHVTTDSPENQHGFPLNRYNWDGGLNLDLPLERKAERNNYRATLISRSRAQRNFELQRDQIEQQVRDSWRTLEQAKKSYEISEIGVKLAERRVEEQELLAELGRAKALDQIDAQNALVSSKDQLTQALVSHTIARLQFWDNMGILYIKENGQWEDLNSSNPEAGTSPPNQQRFGGESSSRDRALSSLATLEESYDNP